MLPERYANVEPIGHGGMGDIFRAEDTALGRTVAVKLLAERYSADDAIRARFTREALAAARVSAEPNTVTTFDVGEWEGRPYIVMEYVPGGTLAERLQREGAQPPGRALEWIAGAGRALDAAHRQGVVHRDVKPGNLLLDEHGQVKVADFGIASAAGLDPLTQIGTVLGTAGYLSPEQARGERADPASDRYALGIVAYELLTGRRPFERESPTAEAAAHANETLPPVTALNPSLPQGLDRVFATALAKDPAARYESCGALVAGLRAPFRDTAAPTQVVPVAPERTTVAAPPRSPASSRRPLWPVLAGVAALLALGGVALASVLAADDPETGARTVERTLTTQGDTVTVTTTSPAEPSPPPPPPPSPPPPPPASGGDPAVLNDEGFRLMQAGDYEAALPLLEQAVSDSQGDGSLTEAYASYNLAFTRFQLGNCDGVLDLLNRSELVQGQRGEIDELRGQAQQECGGGDNGDDD